MELCLLVFKFRQIYLLPIKYGVTSQNWAQFNGHHLISIFLGVNVPINWNMISQQNEVRHFQTFRLEVLCFIRFLHDLHRLSSRSWSLSLPTASFCHLHLIKDQHKHHHQKELKTHYEALLWILIITYFSKCYCDIHADTFFSWHIFLGTSLSITKVHILGTKTQGLAVDQTNNSKMRLTTDQ